jgi:molybdopterin converting factor small subunit
MAKITVRLYSLFRQLTETDYIDLEANDLGEAVKQLELRFGPQIQDRFKTFGIGQNAKIRAYCIFLLNGRSVNKEEFDRVELTEGDILQVFPLGAGG